MEAHTRDVVASSRGDRSTRSDHLQKFKMNMLSLPLYLALLPEEVDQLMVRGTSLGQQVLRVMGEGERDDLESFGI